MKCPKWTSLTRTSSAFRVTQTSFSEVPATSDSVREVGGGMVGAETFSSCAHCHRSVSVVHLPTTALDDFRHPFIES